MVEPGRDLVPQDAGRVMRDRRDERRGRNDRPEADPSGDRNVIAMAPPVIIERDEIDEGIALMDQALEVTNR
jgi:hypothetical protein